MHVLLRRSVAGLSIEFQMLNLLGFLCYSAYNVALFCIPSVQAEYHQAYSKNIPVGLEDVAFSVHAALITAATLTQCVVYDRGDQRFFTVIGICATAAGIAGLAGFGAVGVAEHVRHAEGASLSDSSITWLNLLMLLSTLKLLVSLVKYIPQVSRIELARAVARARLRRDKNAPEMAHSWMQGTGCCSCHSPHLPATMEVSAEHVQSGIIQAHFFLCRPC